jgi:hypothetical protein
MATAAVSNKPFSSFFIEETIQAMSKRRVYLSSVTARLGDDITFDFSINNMPLREFEALMEHLRKEPVMPTKKVAKTKKTKTTKRK